jgi:hypothetical protein
MAKARLKSDPTGTDFEPIGKVVVAAWMKALPDVAGGQITPLDVSELSLAFSNLLDVPCEAVLDTPTKLHIPVPPIPQGVTTKTELIAYLHNKYEESNQAPAMGDPPQKDNPFNPKKTKKHGSPPNFKKRTFMQDFGDAILFGCGR